MDKEKLEIAQEGVMDDIAEAFAEEPVIAGFAIAYGASVIPLILMAPMLSRLEYGEDAVYKQKNFKEDLRGLRTVFKGYIGAGIGYAWFNVDKKIAKAIKLFRDNKTPIYMNEVMWDKVKEFHKKHEDTFEEIKALIAEYKEKIGPKSKAKFEFNKNEEAFEDANLWLEKYLCILDDMNEMVRHVMKDVNGTKMTPVTKVVSGPDAGQMYYVPEETKTGRRISPDIKLSEKEFFDICNEDLCVNFKKTTKVNKVLGRLKNRKGAANKSMKENFQSAIRDLCRAYTHYVCYIYIMCSEAYHKKEKKVEE